MRVRVLKDFTVADRAFRAGEVTEIASPEAVDGLLGTGFVMQDKSLDGAKETKRPMRIVPEKLPEQK